MNTLHGLLARERRSGRSALRVLGDSKRSYDYHRFLTVALKTGNFLSHLGVRHGRTVGIVGRHPESLLSFFGTALLGGVARFDLPRTTEVRALVAPVGRIDEYELPPGGQRVAYGGPPENPGTAHFERDVWSENPSLAPVEVSPTDAVLAVENRTFTHTELLTTAESIAERLGMSEGDEVVLRAPLAEPGAVVAGVVTPLLTGATILLSGGGVKGDIAVALENDAPEERFIDASTLF